MGLSYGGGVDKDQGPYLWSPSGSFHTPCQWNLLLADEQTGLKSPALGLFTKANKACLPHQLQEP